MTGFKTHVLDRYFGYRRLYVDAILARAPRRATLAVVSEIARLTFAIFGCSLTALVFWLLTAGAASRSGVAGWTPVFGACAAASSALGIAALAGLVRAAIDLARVRAAVAPRDGP